MPRKYPSYPAHDQVLCAFCGIRLDGSTSEKFKLSPAGRGQYQQDCPKCRLTTWYDLEASAVPA